MEEQSILTSKAYKRAEANLKDKLKPTFLKHYPHYLVPGYNLHNNLFVDEADLEIIVEQYRDYPYHCDLPKPLLPPARLPRSVLNEEDPVLELVTVKNHINDDIKRMKHYYSKHEKDLKLIYKKDVQWKHDKGTDTAKVPKYLADLAGTMDKDPDPYFEGVYNWYYSGGTLDYVQYHDKNILLFPFMGDLVSAPIENVEEFLWKPLLQKGAKCELDGTLYELKHIINKDTCMILGRYKHHCNFYTLSEYDNKCNLTEIHMQPSKVPYVSADLHLINKNHYCTASAKRSVILWDITKMKGISCHSVQQTTVTDDVWANVKFQLIDPDIILYVDRCCLHYLDTRLPFERPVLTLCPKSHLEKCESLSLDVASRNTFCRYIGTYHSVLMCDSRSPKQCVQQKWTHQFKGPPLMGHTVNREDKEFLMLSSQISGESTIILNTWASDIITHSFNFPFIPPNIMETLNESQMQGMCLNPYLRDRFELCNSGCYMIENSVGDIFLFFQNSVGDIFYQCITHDTALNSYSCVNSKSYCILNSWEKAISVQPDTIVPLTMSEKSNMQHIFECFTNKKLKLKCTDHDSDDVEMSWKQSLEKLNSYTDLLAPELLVVWDVGETVPLPLTAAPHEKVLSWLKSADTKQEILSQEELDNVATPMNSQELISVSQEVDITQLDDSNALQELFLPKVTTQSKKRNIRKK
ncbi:TATA box-binding protein-associated factor RNA polymerase I subunit C-like [Megachile rotundata]|uniref:TATA box-binding protein-associated factor RNA polymerase I subunit C-like n=1 Tax=Megachile rotundata TaxID=143995 RepID=UPI000258F016|nr:PREDICTED: uncharacterized protein LOC100877928 [Megachile rotundata]XP_012147864.1 PREDICTED: uncharacterized protein LOC100877928 [Megachile rotundata]XP_012147865.1 PREDICTED: uncharacterized protein LOC100877928 [Megachile rotundata]